MKVFFHIDIDSYFASAHRVIDPSLNNCPLVVSKSNHNSIAIAISYEARKYPNVYSAMPISIIKKIIPDLKIVKQNFPLYTRLSEMFFNYIRKNYTKNLVVGSIDECFVDVTGLDKKFNMSYQKLAHKIQDEIFRDLKLPASIGVATNLFLAKMSTSINKPFGITHIKESEFLEKCGSWDISKYYTIGKSLAPKLKKLGINTIGDLAATDPNKVRHIFGKNTDLFILQANGGGLRSLEDIKPTSHSISHSITFQDYQRIEYDEIVKEIYLLSYRVASKAKMLSMVGKTFSLSIGTRISGKQKNVTRKQITFEDYTSDFDKLFKSMVKIFDQMWNNEQIVFLAVSMDSVLNNRDFSRQSKLL